MEKRVSENIAAFLHPVKGGPEGQGWEFGKDVYFSEVAALIQGTEGVDRVREVLLKTPQGETNGSRFDPRKRPALFGRTLDSIRRSLGYASAASES